MARFKDLVAETGALVVLSSTWRLIDESVATLRAAGILDHAHPDWRTGYHGSHRGQQIAEWLEHHPEVTHYVILDDDSDMLPEQVPHFVQTRFETGLLDHHCLLARGALTIGHVSGSRPNRPATHVAPTQE